MSNHRDVVITSYKWVIDMIEDWLDTDVKWELSNCTPGVFYVPVGSLFGLSGDIDNEKETAKMICLAVNDGATDEVRMLWFSLTSWENDVPEDEEELLEDHHPELTLDRGGVHRHGDEDDDKLYYEVKKRFHWGETENLFIELLTGVKLCGD